MFFLQNKAGEIKSDCAVFLHFADCIQIENPFCKLCNLHKLHKIDNGTPTCRSEKTFIHFADCTQIENGFCKLCNLHKLHKLITVRYSKAEI